MLGLYRWARIFISRSCKIYLIISIAAFFPLHASFFDELHGEVLQHKNFSDIKWIFDGLASLNENTPVDGAVRFAAKVKRKVEKITGERYSVNDLFKKCRKEMKKTASS